MVNQSAKQVVQQYLVVALVLAIVEAGPLSLHHCFTFDVSHMEFIEETEEHKTKIPKSARGTIAAEVAVPNNILAAVNYFNTISSHRIDPPVYLRICTFLI